MVSYTFTGHFLQLGHIINYECVRWLQLNDKLF